MKSIKNILLIALPLVCTSHIMAQNALKIEKEITGGRNGVQEYNITKETKEGKKYTVEQNITGGKNGIWDLAISEVVEGKKVKLFSFENAGGESGVFESNIKNGKVDIHTTEKVNFNNAYNGTASPDSLFDMLINTVQQSSGNKESIESILSMTNKLTEAPGTGRRMLTTRVEITADSTIRRNDTTEIKVGRNRIVIIGDAKVDKIYKDENGTVIEEEDEDKEEEDEDSAI